MKERIQLNKPLLDKVSEDDLFTILAHPLRRQILSYMNEFGHISFSQMSKEWKISTGTIYHHLKILDILITKNENQLYELTEVGQLVSNWYIEDEEGKTTIAKIDAVTYFGTPLIVLFERHWKLLIIMSLMLILGTLSTVAHFKIVILGPFLFVDKDNSISISYVVINVIILILFLIIYLGFYFALTQDSTLDLKLLSIYFLQYWPNYIFIIFLTFFDESESAKITSSNLFILAIVTQLLYLVLNTSFLVITKNVNVERSIIHSIITLYSYLLINTLIFKS